MTQFFNAIQPMKPYDLTEQDLIRIHGNPMFRFQPKIDGIRTILHRPAHWPRAAGAVAQTASGLQIPNGHIRNSLYDLIDRIEWALLQSFPVEFVEKVIRAGIDGEVAVKGNFQDVSSGVMSRSGTPEFTFFAFDVAIPHTTFQTRANVLASAWSALVINGEPDPVVVLPDYMTRDSALNACRHLNENGFKTDGIIVRNLMAPYKFGRSTPTDGGLGRFKPLAHAEGTIVGFIEGETNLNAAKLDRFGRTKRSSSQEGKIPNGSLGAFVISSPAFSEPFQIGTGEGLTHALRQSIWNNRPSYMGETVTFSYLLEGSTPEAPRQPIWRGFRHKSDTTNY